MKLEQYYYQHNTIPDNWEIEHGIYSFHAFMEVSFVEPESVPEQDYSDGKNILGKINPESELVVIALVIPGQHPPHLGFGTQKEVTAREFAEELEITLWKLAEAVVEQQIDKIQHLIWNQIYQKK
jgi:hypothetical protein